MLLVMFMFNQINVNPGIVWLPQVRALKAAGEMAGNLPEGGVAAFAEDICALLSVKDQERLIQELHKRLPEGPNKAESAGAAALGAAATGAGDVAAAAAGKGCSAGLGAPSSTSGGGGADAPATAATSTATGGAAAALPSGSGGGN
jgi:hypothetical protein